MPSLHPFTFLMFLSLVYIHIYIYTYRRFSVFTTSVGLAALAPIIGASVSEPPSSDANGNFVFIYIYYYYVSYVVPHILNLSNLTHVTSIKYV